MDRDNLWQAAVTREGGVCAVWAGEGGGQEGAVSVQPLHAGSRGEEKAVQQAG